MEKKLFKVILIKIRYQNTTINFKHHDEFLTSLKQTENKINSTFP